jgi:hypothetical protein
MRAQMCKSHVCHKCTVFGVALLKQDQILPFTLRLQGGVKSAAPTRLRRISGSGAERAARLLLGRRNLVKINEMLACFFFDP